MFWFPLTKQHHLLRSWKCAFSIMVAILWNEASPEICNPDDDILEGLETWFTQALGQVWMDHPVGNVSFALFLDGHLVILLELFLFRLKVLYFAVLLNLIVVSCPELVGWSGETFTWNKIHR